jgi:Helitron helicase-like domain at N-terminus
MKRDSPYSHLENQLLPIWYLHGQPQFHVPGELSCLTLAEKMLIQLASPFIPLRHIKNGAFGLSGHVCCFEQDVGDFVNTLPREKSDVTMLNVLKTVRTEIGSDSMHKDVYKVRKKQVGDALLWLKEFNREYKHIRIDMRALDWLRGPEGSMEVLELPTNEEIYTQQDECRDQNSDLGPVRHMTIETLQSGDNVNAFGYMDDSPGKTLSPEDRTIHNALVSTIEGSDMKKDIHINWPAHGPVAMSEYGSSRIFARAFPWLFPGGFGDFKDYPGDINKWGEDLLYYEDGRFCTDKFFTFFALNYITRNRNANSGNWFINGFNTGGPQSLQELQDSIRKGDTKFVNRLTYFNKRVKGSTAYWLQQRAQVYSWINYHVETGNGPPTFFITLSCGEYYWPDIIRLLRERMNIARDARESECFPGSKMLTKIINDYSIVIQEFFQKRVQLWLQEVGRPVFGIQHYWGRFEFAPGRGQIHIHLLAIRKDQTILRLCHEDLHHTDGKERRALRLAQWASDHFGLTAKVDPDFDERNIQPNNSPCAIRFTDVANHPQNISAIRDDQQNLMKFCQVHDCNGFCLRMRNNRK